MGWWCTFSGLQQLGSNPVVPFRVFLEPARARFGARWGSHERGYSSWLDGLEKMTSFWMKCIWRDRYRCDRIISKLQELYWISNMEADGSSNHFSLIHSSKLQLQFHSSRQNLVGIRQYSVNTYIIPPGLTQCQPHLQQRSSFFWSLNRWLRSLSDTPALWNSSSSLWWGQLVSLLFVSLCARCSIKYTDLLKTKLGGWVDQILHLDHVRCDFDYPKRWFLSLEFERGWKTWYNYISHFKPHWFCWSLSNCFHLNLTTLVSNPSESVIGLCPEFVHFNTLCFPHYIALVVVYLLTTFQPLIQHQPWRALISSDSDTSHKNPPVDRLCLTTFHAPFLRLSVPSIRG